MYEENPADGEGIDSYCMYAYIGIWCACVVLVAFVGKPTKSELIFNAIHDAGWCILPDGTKMLKELDPFTQKPTIVPYRQAHMANSPWFGKKKPKIQATHEEVEFTLLQ
jgi:hypothetical protein